MTAHETPGNVQRWKETFNSVNGNDVSKEEIETVVRHDIELFRNIIKGNQSGSLGDYYLGLLKWIEEHGDQKYLPFLEELLDEYSEPFPDKDATSPYLNKYDRGDLYEISSNVWFKLKSEDMKEDEITDMLIDSLRYNSDVPKINQKIWAKYSDKLKDKRNKIYDILLNEDISELYDMFLSRGRFSLYDLFRIEGLSPEDNEIAQLLNNNERLVARDNLIMYLIETKEVKKIDRMAEIIIKNYINLNIAENHMLFIKHNTILNRFVLKFGYKLDEIFYIKIQKALICKIENIHPFLWEHRDSESLISYEQFEFTLNILSKIKTKLTKETKKELKKYAENIKGKIGDHYSEEKNRALIKNIKEIEKIIGEKIED
jgi:hypothetical protein